MYSLMESSNIANQFSLKKDINKIIQNKMFISFLILGIVLAFTSISTFAVGAEVEGILTEVATPLISLFSKLLIVGGMLGGIFSLIRGVGSIFTGDRGGILAALGGVVKCVCLVACGLLVSPFITWLSGKVADSGGTTEIPTPY